MASWGNLCPMPQEKPNWEKMPPRDWAEHQAFRVAQEIRRLRDKRSAQWLADQTKQLGYGVTRIVISDLENGRRRYVTSAELTILAFALGTSPVALLFPPPYTDDQMVELIPDHEVTKFFAAQAFSGLPPYVNRYVTIDQARPLYRAREIAQLEDQQRFLILQLEEFSGVNPALGDRLRLELERVATRIKELRVDDAG